jgi:hypothetical protein
VFFICTTYSTFFFLFPLKLNHEWDFDFFSERRNKYKFCFSFNRAFLLFWQVLQKSMLSFSLARLHQAFKVMLMNKTEKQTNKKATGQHEPGIWHNM